MSIEAVIFDYGGVLSTTPFAGIAEFERKMSYPEKSLAQLLFGRGASPQGPTVAPEAAVFLDDTRRHVEAARQVGLQAILVRDPLASLAELDALLEAAAA